MPAPRTSGSSAALWALVAALVCLVTGQSPLVHGAGGVRRRPGPAALGPGLPDRPRRKKKFTNEFANAIDVIVRCVQFGPAHQRGAAHRGARNRPIRWARNSRRLVEGLKVGVTLEQGLKKMYESMPTAEVGFFAIVMTIQAKSGGNLSEALSNLAAVLRDRKRLQGKIKAMSSEAKASAMIIGSLPPVVMGIV